MKKAYKWLIGIGTVAIVSLFSLNLIGANALKNTPVPSEEFSSLSDCQVKYLSRKKEMVTYAILNDSVDYCQQVEKAEEEFKTKQKQNEVLMAMLKNKN